MKGVKNIMQKTNKKGQLMAMGDLAKGIAILAIVAVVVIMVQTQTLSTGQVNSSANATNTLRIVLHESQSMFDWVPLVIIVAVGALLLSMLYMFSGRR